MHARPDVILQETQPLVEHALSHASGCAKEPRQ
jgi:hypothetical protein